MERQRRTQGGGASADATAPLALGGTSTCNVQALMERSEDPAHHIQQVFESFVHPQGAPLSAMRGAGHRGAGPTGTHAEGGGGACRRDAGLGFITRASAHAAFRSALPHVSGAVVDEVFDELDVDQDGRVGLRDFVGMMTAPATAAPRAGSGAAVRPGG